MIRIAALAIAAISVFVEYSPAQELLLKLKTKLGVETEVEVTSVTAPDTPLFWFGSMGVSRKFTTGGNTLKDTNFAFRLDKQTYFLAPWPLIQSLDSQDKWQHLTLTNGIRLKGEAVTQVVTTDTKKYQLQSLNQMRVVRAEKREPVKSKAGVTRTLRLHGLVQEKFEVSSVYFYPKYLNGDVALGGATQSFKVSIAGEELQGNFIDFDKLSLTQMKGKEWQLRLQTGGAGEKTGTFVIPTRVGETFIADWFMAGMMPDNCIIVFKGDFELSKR